MSSYFIRCYTNPVYEQLVNNASSWERPIAVDVTQTPVLSPMYQVKQEVDRFSGFRGILLSLCLLGQCHDTGGSKLEWVQEGWREEGGIGGRE